MASPVGLGHPVQVEDLIVEPDDGAAAGVKVPPAEQPGRVVRRGGVERPRGRGPPVNQDRLVFLVVQPDPANIESAAIGVVHSAEAEAALHPVQLGKPPGQLRGGDFALHPGRERAACAATAVHLAQGVLAAPPGCVEQAVQHGNVILLFSDGLGKSRLGLTFGHIICYTPRRPK
jgi:hypothetical protein